LAKWFRASGEVAGNFRHQAADGGIIITNQERSRLLEMAKIKYRIARLGFDTRPAAVPAASADVPVELDFYC
jgi:hypothetical protein